MSDRMARLIAENQALRAERDRAREEVGFEKGIKNSIREELYNFIQLRTEALARAEAAEARLAAVEALADEW